MNKPEQNVLRPLPKGVLLLPKENLKLPVWAICAAATLMVLPTSVSSASEIRPTEAPIVGSATVALTENDASVAVAAAPEALPYVGVFGYQPLHVFYFNPLQNADTYSAEWTADGQTWAPIATGGGNYFEHTFAPGTYQVRIRAENAHGAGPFTTTIPFSVGTNYIRPVPLDHRISRLYLAAFQRQPDDEGFFNWYDQHIDGVPLKTIASGFTSSAEFRATYGSLNNTQFVEVLYQNVFGRPLDPAGRATWVGLLDRGGSRGQVLAGLSSSPEFVAATGTVPASSKTDGRIYRLYAASFKRAPDAGGMVAWRTALESGRSLESVAEWFVNSSEFAQTYGTLDNAEFVDLLYHHTRNVDPALNYSQEKANWVAELAAGKSRGEVLLAFSEYPGFIHRTGTAP